MKGKPKARMVQPEVVQPLEGALYQSVRAIIARARAVVYVAANAAMVEGGVLERRA